MRTKKKRKKEISKEEEKVEGNKIFAHGVRHGTVYLLFSIELFPLLLLLLLFFLLLGCFPSLLVSWLSSLLLFLFCFVFVVWESSERVRCVIVLVSLSLGPPPPKKKTRETKTSKPGPGSRASPSRTPSCCSGRTTAAAAASTAWLRLPTATSSQWRVSERNGPVASSACTADPQQRHSERGGNNAQNEQRAAARRAPAHSGSAQTPSCSAAQPSRATQLGQAVARAVRWRAQGRVLHPCTLAAMAPHPPARARACRAHHATRRGGAKVGAPCGNRKAARRPRARRGRAAARAARRAGAHGRVQRAGAVWHARAGPAAAGGPLPRRPFYLERQTTSAAVLFLDIWTPS